MSRKASWYLGVAAICLMPVAAAAEDKPAQDQSQEPSMEGDKGAGGAAAGGEFSLEGEPGMKAEEAKEPSWETQSELEFTSEVEIGILYNSRNSFKHGEYTGLTDKAPYGIGNFDVRLLSPYDSKDTDYVKMEGSNIGLDSRELKIEAGRQGSFKGYVGFNQIPKYFDDSASTIFNGTGTGNLTLPNGWVAGAATGNILGELHANLKPIDLDYDRKQGSLGFAVNLAPNWEFHTDYQREWKDGAQTIGGIIGSPGGRAVLLPQPISYVTDQATIGLSYADRIMQAELTYYMSLFNNQEPSLSWINPFSNPAGAGSGTGALSLPPDNQFHQITFSGGYNIDMETNTRATLDVSYGWMLQNDTFMPYTANPTFAASIVNPLPRNSLDGEINTMLINLRLSSHPWKDVHLRGGYRYDDRANNTPVALYNYVRTDSETQQTANLGRYRFNLPYSFETHKADVEADYDFMPHTTGTLGYEFETIHRNLQEVDNTYEHTATARLKTSPFESVTVNLKGLYADRRGSNYDCTGFGVNGFLTGVEECIIDPTLRKAYEADRNRYRGGVDLLLTPFDEVSVGLRTDFVRDAYLNSTLGLRNRDTDSYTVDVSSGLIDDVSLYGYYTLYLVASRQIGTNTAGNPATIYQVRDYDTIHTAGVGLDWKAIPDKLDFNFDYTFSYATTSYDFRESPGLTSAPLPDLKTRLQSVGLMGTYHFRKDVALKVGYRFERYKTSDWAYDNIAFNTVSSVLGLGQVSPDYNVHLFGASVAYKF